MPRRLKTVCTWPGCNTLVLGGRCQKHSRHKEDRRPSASKRGYDNHWHKLRNAFIRDNPLCQIRHYCDGDPAVEVDHIIPIRAGGLRLDEDNLQSTCKRCHAWKTATHDATLY